MKIKLTPKAKEQLNEVTGVVFEVILSIIAIIVLVLLLGYLVFTLMYLVGAVAHIKVFPGTLVPSLPYIWSFVGLVSLYLFICWLIKAITIE